jgi:type II secretory pathway pseudopilin PulG
MRRRGVTILELSIAIILVGAVLAGIAQLLSAVSAQQRESERRLAALHEAANQMERLATLAWSELTSEGMGPRELSPEAAAALPQGSLRILVTDAAGGADSIEGKRVSVEVAWRNSAGREVKPVRLAAWRFAAEEGASP